MTDEPEIKTVFVGPPGGGMYNVVFGKQPLADALRALLQVRYYAEFDKDMEVGRFRDAWVERDGDGILIRLHTRNGGGNREEYDHESLHNHPWYVRDADMEFDSTYADYWYRPDPKWFMENYSPSLPDSPRKEAVWELILASAVEPVNMQERWEAAIQALEDANREDHGEDTDD